MKKTSALLLALGLAATSFSGCAYSGTTAVGDKVVVLRNDGFLFGILRKAYVCKVSDNGLSSCSAGENP